MTKRWLLAVALMAGCGTDPDPREPTTEVIVLEVLQPSCGQVQCHSQTTQTAGYAFDTYHRAVLSIDRLGGPGEILDVVEGAGYERMPADSPLNDQDVTLIQKWIVHEASQP